MIREDLIVSAVNLLQQPQVAAAPLEKRIAFLQSKNLTSEEINAALQRVGESPVAPAAGSVAPYVAPPLPPQPGYAGGGGYYPAGQLAQRAQDGQPTRDWRDWFVMATITGGVGYGLFHLAKRYVYPVIAPPTPEQLSQDKAAIDASFAEAFQLLDQLSTDTAALKAAEEERTKRVDTCLEEVESVIEQLKATAKRREEEGKRVGEEVRSLRDLIPKALEGQKEAQAQALTDLQNELKSLKALVVNRQAAAAAGGPGMAGVGGMGMAPRYPGQGVMNGTPPLDPGAAMNGGSAGSAMVGAGNVVGAGAGGMRKDAGSSPLPFGLPQVKPAIPDWQKAMSGGGSTSGESS
ncbi:peroxisomal membrane anchor protein conserved region-domain-containing protein [Tirmania nivea]|nr:peroxisomal membrane anchor protein conserved region-domain-containing protein [Tirmania nivea]